MASHASRTLLASENWGFHTYQYRCIPPLLDPKLDKIQSVQRERQRPRDMQNPSSGQSAVYLDILRGLEDSISDDQNLMIGTNFREFHSFGLKHGFEPRNKRRNSKIVWNLVYALHGDDVLRIHTEHPHRMEQGTWCPQTPHLRNWIAKPMRLPSQRTSITIWAWVHCALCPDYAWIHPVALSEKEENTALGYTVPISFPGLE